MDEECNAAVGNKAAAEDLKKEKLLQDGDSDSSGKENKNALSVVNDSLQTIIKDEKPIRTGKAIFLFVGCWLHNSAFE